ncbi:MAG: hypothetical protein IH984_11145 [Planctomycetes bacterium]|nr:hypothetical protein [Planctomycetota bacterium]
MTSSKCTLAGIILLCAAAFCMTDNARATGDNTVSSVVSEKSSNPDPRFDALLNEVRSLRDEVQHLRGKTDDSWLTEQRAEEIRALTLDVLADVDTRASLKDGGALTLMAGHDGDHFFLKSPDGNFLMGINGLLQYRWIGNFRGNESGRASTSPDDDNETGFEFRRVELGFGGHVFSPEFGYTLVLATEDGAAGVEQLIAQDVVLSYAASDNLTWLAGRYFAPFLREELMGGGGSLAVALSFMNNNLSIGRGEGISAVYQTDSFRVHGFLSDGAGSGGGGGVNNPTADGVELAGTVRADFKLDGEWGQWGGFSAWEDQPSSFFLGGAIHYQSGESGDSLAANDVDLFGWTIDGSIQNGGFNLFVAAAGNHTESDTAVDIDNYGFVVQAGYMVVPDKFEPFLRYEVMMFDELLGLVEDDVNLITFGANYYLNDNVELTFDIVWALDPIPGDSLNAGLLADGVEEDQIVARAQVQLKF